MEPSAKHCTIPLGIVKHVIQNDLVKAFTIFLYLKSLCSGVLAKTNISFEEMGERVGMKDMRTLDKYLKHLININWIGYNRKTGTYFIRSFKHLQSIGDLKSNRGIRIDFNSLKNLKVHLCSGLIAARLMGLKNAQNEFVKRQVGSSALKKHSALQIFKELNLRSYFGLSNTQLAELFKCSKSEANRIKLNCINEGLLIANKRFKHLATFSSPDHLFKSIFPHPNKIRVTGDRKFGIRVYEQLTDELISTVYCVKMNRHHAKNGNI